MGRSIVLSNLPWPTRTGCSIFWLLAPAKVVGRWIWSERKVEVMLQQGCSKRDMVRRDMAYRATIIMMPVAFSLA